ncbi:MerC domain-containing protein [Hyphobacterium sp.]|uniref:MerC domain-containing protein n=1 Tax=Hyphobacterium sp. TaxID=2004662 RepID=UPI003BAB9D49
MADTPAIQPKPMDPANGFGIGVSTLCILHCLATPFLAAAIPAVAWIENEWAHIILAGFAILFVVLAMPKWPGGTFGLGLRVVGLLAVATLMGAAFAEIGETAERVVTVIAASVLALTHIVGHSAAMRRARVGAA